MGSYQYRPKPNSTTLKPVFSQHSALVLPEPGNDLFIRRDFRLLDSFGLSPPEVWLEVVHGAFKMDSRVQNKNGL